MMDGELCLGTESSAGCTPSREGGHSRKAAQHVQRPGGGKGTGCVRGGEISLVWLEVPLGVDILGLVLKTLPPLGGLCL